MPIWTDIRAGGNQNAYVARGVYTAEPQATATSTPAGTSTPTSTPTPSGTATRTSTPTSTTRPSDTRTVTSTITPTLPPAATNTPAATVTPTVCPIQFSDVPNGSTFYPYIRCLACRNIVSGYSDGTFRPNNNVTRGQTGKIDANTFFPDCQTPR